MPDESEGAQSPSGMDSFGLDGGGHTGHPLQDDTEFAFMNFIADDEREFEFALATQRQGSQPADESRLALVDTACTLCMHSRTWREAFEKHLPHGRQCEPTEKFKNFGFANGKRQAGCQVFRIPIGIAGHEGEVHSAELTQGSTPLLFSVSALAALDGEIRVKTKTLTLQALGVSVPLIETRTRHLGMDVSQFGCGKPAPERKSEFQVRADRGDLYIYYLQEAEFDFNGLEVESCDHVAEAKVKEGPKLHPRGVRQEDRRGQLREKRYQQLKQAAERIEAKDSRTWIAMRRTYTMAENLATGGFRNSVIFEPWGGSFVVTRTGALSFGWTNAQPLDKIDGYDLQAASGQRLLWQVLTEQNPYLVVVAFDCRIWSLLTNLNPNTDWDALRQTVGIQVLRLVARICRHRHRCGRYFLIEQPAGAMSWTFRGILQKVIDEEDVFHANGAQCAFEKRDADSGKLQRKNTGYCTNSQAILNRIAFPCRCPPGTHEAVIGSNSHGSRSGQAAAYPPLLAKAICEGVLHQMKLDYAAFQAGEDVFAAEELGRKRPREVLEAPGSPDASSVPETPGSPGASGSTKAPGCPGASRNAKSPGSPGDARSTKKARLGRPPRPRELRQGAWQKVSGKERLDLLHGLVKSLPSDGPLTQVLWSSHDLACTIVEMEERQATVKMLIVRQKPKKLLLPQPHLHPYEVPLRNAYLFRPDGEVWEILWEG